MIRVIVFGFLLYLMFDLAVGQDRHERKARVYLEDLGYEYVHGRITKTDCGDNEWNVENFWVKRDAQSPLQSIAVCTPWIGRAHHTVLLANPNDISEVFERRRIEGLMESFRRM